MVDSQTFRCILTDPGMLHLEISDRSYDGEMSAILFVLFFGFQFSSV